MKFVVTVEIEHDAGMPEPLLPKVDEWVVKLIRDRMSGLKRGSKGFTKGSRRYKAWISEIDVERFHE